MSDKTQSPSEAEILSLAYDCNAMPEACTDASLANFARAVLAKWGTPAAGDPVAWLWQHCETGRTRVVMPDQIITTEATWNVVGPLHLGTAPQPAERKPLTEAQRERTYRNRPENVGKGIALADWHRVVQYIEGCHGITDGGGNADRKTD